MSRSIVKENAGTLLEISKNWEFDWTINVGELLQYTFLHSPEFSFSSSSWTFALEMKKSLSVFSFIGDSFWDSLLFFLRNMQLDATKCVTIEVVWKKGDGLSFYPRGGFHLFHASEGVSCSRSLILVYKPDLVDAIKNCSQLILRIKLREFVHCDDDAYTLHKLRIKDTDILHQNYEDLLLSGEDHDLILKVKEKEFKAHRIIMKCRCPVFKSMMVHEMLEKNSGVVEIPDCDPCAFEQFLFYVYTGDWKTVDNGIMPGLYYIADKYDMANLKEKCQDFMKKSLSVNVVTDVISLALKHHDSSLLECATEYFIDNAKKIIVTVEWQSFIKENPIQANELFLKTINKCPFYLAKEKSKTDLNTKTLK